jgi:hypothetical protein
MGDVIVGISGVLNPVGELVSLNVREGPVPGILTFNNVESVVKSKSHG